MLRRVLDRYQLPLMFVVAEKVGGPFVVIPLAAWLAGRWFRAWRHRRKVIIAAVALAAFLLLRTQMPGFAALSILAAAAAATHRVRASSRWTPNLPAASVWEPVRFGTDIARRREYTLRLFETHGANSYLFAGVRGAGKTSGITLPLAHAALDPTVRLYIVDPKLELRIWRDRATGYADTVPDAVQMLDTVAAEMMKQAHLLAENGMSNIEQHPDLSPIVLVIDEYAVPKLQDKQFEQKLIPIILMGRSAGVATIVGTQHPITTVISSQVRENLTECFGFRCKTPEQNVAVFGQGSDADATAIPKRARGRCIVDEDDGPRTIQTYWLSDENRQRIAEQCAPR